MKPQWTYEEDPGGDPLGGYPGTIAPAHAEEQVPPVPPEALGPGETEPACKAQNGAPGEPGPGASGPLPGGPQAEEEPREARDAAKGSHGIRALLGLGPPRGRPGVVKAGKGGKPAKAKTKRALKGPASQRARGSPFAVHADPFRRSREPQGKTLWLA